MTDNEFDFNFDHLQIDNAVARCAMPMLAPGVFFMVRPVGEANDAYHSASLALAGKRQRAKVLSSDFTAEDSKLDREDDRKLYPKHVIMDWGGVTRVDGTPVPFSRQAATALVSKMPAWVFDRLRLFCIRPENFTQLPEALPDAKTLAGN